MKLLFQEESADVLCSGLVALVGEKCPDLLEKAKDTYERFTKILTQYSKCHKIINGGVVTDAAIEQLGNKNICISTSSHLLHFQRKT